VKQRASAERREVEHAALVAKGALDDVIEAKRFAWNPNREELLAGPELLGLEFERFEYSQAVLPLYVHDARQA
jgi:hypothetical protein